MLLVVQLFDSTCFWIAASDSMVCHLPMVALLQMPSRKRLCKQRWPLAWA